MRLLEYSPFVLLVGVVMVVTMWNTPTDSKSLEPLPAQLGLEFTEGRVASLREMNRQSTSSGATAGRLYELTLEGAPTPFMLDAEVQDEVIMKLKNKRVQAYYNPRVGNIIYAISSDDIQLQRKGEGPQLVLNTHPKNKNSNALWTWRLALLLTALGAVGTFVNIRSGERS